MKRQFLFFISLGFFLISCQISNDRSDAYGNFEATEVIVSAQSNGEILALDLEEGDLIKKGQIIGYIDTTHLSLNKKVLQQQKTTVSSQLLSIDAEMKVVQQQLANAQVNQQRITNMKKSGAATQQQVDDINGLVDLYFRQIDAIKIKKRGVVDQMATVDVQIELVNDAIEKSLITNPNDGTVLVKYAEMGEVAAMGKPLYKLADLRRMKLKAYISGDQLPNISIGQEVEVLFDKGVKENQSTTGTVSWISSSAEFTPKTIQTKEERVSLVYAIKVAVENNGKIKIGMPGECRFSPSGE